MLKRRVDALQQEIVAALRAAGCSVADLHGVGHGVPDLLVSRADVNHLIEVKSSATARLTQAEAEFIAGWQAPVYIVHSVREALEAVGFSTTAF